MLLHRVRVLTAEASTAVGMLTACEIKREEVFIVSVKIFGVKGVGGVLSIVLPIVMWLVDRFWQKENDVKI